MGPKYQATLKANALPVGTSDTAINEAKGLFEQAAEKCPDTQIVAGGYGYVYIFPTCFLKSKMVLVDTNDGDDDSQGTAVMHGAIPKLSDDIKNKIKDVALFGDTRNQHDNGQIPDFTKPRPRFIVRLGIRSAMGV